MIICLPIPVKIKVLKYVKNTYLSEILTMQNQDLIELITLFTKLVTDLESLSELNRIGDGDHSSKDYYLITNENYIDVNSQNSDYCDLFLECCEQLIYIHMKNEEEKKLRRTQFDNLANEILATMLSVYYDFASSTKKKATDLIVLINDLSVEEQITLDVDRFTPENQRLFARLTSVDHVQVEENRREEEELSLYQVFTNLVRMYKESDQFSKDVDAELKKLIEMVLDAEMRPDTDENLPIQLSSRTLCGSLISYLKIYDANTSEPPNRSSFCLTKA